MSTFFEKLVLKNKKTANFFVGQPFFILGQNELFFKSEVTKKKLPRRPVLVNKKLPRSPILVREKLPRSLVLVVMCKETP